MYVGMQNLSFPASFHFFKNNISRDKKSFTVGTVLKPLLLYINGITICYLLQSPCIFTLLEFRYIYSTHNFELTLMLFEYDLQKKPQGQGCTFDFLINYIQIFMIVKINLII